MALPPPRRQGQIEKLSDGYHFQRLKASMNYGLPFVCGWCDLSKSYTRTARKVDKKIVGMESKKRRIWTFVVDIVPKVSVLSFGNRTDIIMISV